MTMARNLWHQKDYVMLHFLATGVIILAAMHYVIKVDTYPSWFDDEYVETNLKKSLSYTIYGVILTLYICRR